MRTRIFTLIFSLALAIFSLHAYAKEINLYDQPKPDAKIIGKVDLAIGIVPVFTPKEGGWMKVGDPRNGNVGWVKTTDLGSGTDTSAITFTQKVIHDGNTPYTYQFIQYGQPQKLTAEQIKEMAQKMQTQQKAVQQSVQKAIQNMIKDMDVLYRHQLEVINEMGGFPVVVPVVVTPQQTKPAPSQTAPAVQQQNSPSKSEPLSTPAAKP
ncbi:hypothetical protein [Aquicella lusitana]|uniref:SH3 domain-containing protein n=1 Tax=Aquicella lusitana TaxID=254246 RepID=A0A370G572_9COXI|nr:hypothetical protein [Aquicella lusitana]RDI38958.1 SH3 domain-containing protein [Aquicella lusitana]VVC74293.1 hypothetical protein AQULUS_20580 [Aquicella lusitana]